MARYEGTCERCGTPFVKHRAHHQVAPRYCSNHCRLNRNGETPADVLNHFVDKSGGPESCWPFTGPTRKGYGYVFCNYRYVRAHRLAWEIANGPIPGDLIVCHRCDHRRCCNPAHLFLGDYADNNADRANKGRTTRGSGHHAAKLTESDIPDIRKMKGKSTLANAAQMYGVSICTIWRIWMRQAWAHVD